MELVDPGIIADAATVTTSLPSAGFGAHFLLGAKF